MSDPTLVIVPDGEIWLPVKLDRRVPRNEIWFMSEAPLVPLWPDQAPPLLPPLEVVAKIVNVEPPTAEG